MLATVVPDANDRKPDLTPPEDGEQTGNQGIAFPGGMMVGERTWQANDLGLRGNIGWGAPGVMGNPCAFPYYGSLYLGTYNTYRWMLNHPKIRHARSIVMSPIIDADWEVIKDESATQEMVDYVKDVILPLRNTFAEDAMRFLDFGWAGFEPVWGKSETYGYPLEWLKPLYPDLTTHLWDLKGNFVGFSQGGTENQMMVPYKAALITYDRECQNSYGRSRLENIRETAWRGWLDCAQQLSSLGGKIAGVIGMMFGPTGTFKDSDGNRVSYRQNMVDAINTMRNLGFAIFSQPTPANLLGSGTDPEKMAKVMDAITKSIRVQWYDAGNHSAAIEGFLKKMQHDEELMFEGYMRSPRTGSESRHGSRADAQTHTETGILDSEYVAGRFDDQFNRNVLDPALMLNFGPKAKGLVKVNTPALQDSSGSNARTIMGLMIQSNPILAFRIAAMMGNDGMRTLIATSGQTVTKAWDDTEGDVPDALKGGAGDPNPKVKDATKPTVKNNQGTVQP